MRVPLIGSVDDPMTISGHKTRSVFERYNIVDEKDLQLAAQKQHAYLESRMGTKPGTVALSPKKKGEARTANPFILLVPGAGIELVLTRMKSDFIPCLTKF